MFAVFHITDGRQPWILLTGFHSIFIICHVYCSVVVTSPKNTLMATLIGEVKAISAHGIPYAGFCAFLLRRI